MLKKEKKLMYDDISPPTFYSMSLFLSCQMEKILFGVHLPVMGFDNTNHDKKGIRRIL